MSVRKPYTVAFHTLGCKVNQYETQSMSEHFADAGFSVVAEGLPSDVCVINTCSVTNIADRKSRQIIRRARKLNPDAVIAVTGCYVQTAPEDVVLMEDVDIAAGNNEKGNLVEYVTGFLERRKMTAGEESDRQTGAESHILAYEELTEYEDLGCITAMESRSRAFIKIQDGCNRFCSYCIIPYARGRVRSRAPESVLLEARSLLSAGYRELVLTGINTALYGADTEGRTDIIDLIAAIESIEGDFRIRLSSLEPNVVDRGTAERLLEHPKVCHHMHLAMQSGCDTVLKRMNRRYSVDDYRKIVDTLRRGDPQYGITTDIIVGFPGETEEEFLETMETVREIGFSRVHIFRYSMRDGTAAAARKDQIDGRVKSRRAELLSGEADRAQEIFFRRNLGAIRPVLFESADPRTGWMEGYTDNYIKVYVKTDGRTDVPDHFTDVRLAGVMPDGMRGELLDGK